MRQHFDFTSPIDRPSPSDVLRDMLMASIQPRPLVYPGYLSFRIKQALVAAKADPTIDKPIVADVGAIDRIGDARDRIIVTDCNGTRYRITVEIVPEAADVGIAAVDAAVRDFETDDFVDGAGDA